MTEARSPAHVSCPHTLKQRESPHRLTVGSYDPVSHWSKYHSNVTRAVKTTRIQTADDVTIIDQSLKLIFHSTQQFQAGYLHEALSGVSHLTTLTVNMTAASSKAFLFSVALPRLAVLV